MEFETDWIDWAGGDIPAELVGVPVIVRLRAGGETHTAVHADELDWQWASGTRRLMRQKHDIVAYRIVAA